MNFRSLFLERPFDVRLCEAHDFMSAGIEASAAMTQTGVTELMNLINNNRNNATNMNIANANNQTAVAIARENNQLQRQLLKLQQEYESAEAERARLWNSPVNQVRLMREAGINPATAIAGGSGSMGTSSAMAHAPSSGVSPSMPTLTTPRMEAYRIASPSAAMADIGAAIASLESANKTSKEAELAEKSMNDVLRRIKADADTSEVARDIELIYGSQKANMEVSVMKADLAVKTEQALNLVKEGKFIEAKTILTRTEERVTQMDYHLKKSQNAILQNDLKTYFTTLNARLDNMRSQSASNYASARVSSEVAYDKHRYNEILDSYNVTKDGINPLREWVKAGLSKAVAENNLMDWQAKRIEDVLPYIVQQAENDARTGKPWTSEYFVHRLVGPVGGAAANSAANAILLLLK